MDTTVQDFRKAERKRLLQRAAANKFYLVWYMFLLWLFAWGGIRDVFGWPLVWFNLISWEGLGFALWFAWGLLGLRLVIQCEGVTEELGYLIQDSE
jgi:hypothetical protein